jgi:ribosome-associated protein
VGFPQKGGIWKKNRRSGLDQFMKLVGLVEVRRRGQSTSSKDGEVLVNGEVETRRSKKLHAGDRVTLGDYEAVVELDENE